MHPMGEGGAMESPLPLDRLSPGVLSREQLRDRIRDPQQPLVTELVDLDTQLQPNGLDVTLRSISRYEGMGTIGAHNSDRTLPDLTPIAFDEHGWVALEPGPYHIVYNEIVHLPPDLMALGRPRSSVTRSGVAIHTAVWDAGYSGRSTSLLVAYHPAGFRLQRNARIMQLVFMSLATATRSGYEGAYQHENVG
jgi:dUTP pyrophosphatase